MSTKAIPLGKRMENQTTENAVFTFAPPRPGLLGERDCHTSFLPRKGRPFSSFPCTHCTDPLAERHVPFRRLCLFSLLRLGCLQQQRTMEQTDALTAHFHQLARHYRRASCLDLSTLRQRSNSCCPRSLFQILIHMIHSPFTRKRLLKPPPPLPPH